MWYHCELQYNGLLVAQKRFHAQRDVMKCDCIRIWCCNGIQNSEQYTESKLRILIGCFQLILAGKWDGSYMYLGHAAFFLSRVLPAAQEPASFFK